MSDDAPGLGPAAISERASRAAARIESLGRKAGLTLFWENLWPRLAAGMVLVAVFLVVSWLGLWTAVPTGARIAGVVLFGLALAGVLAWAARTQLPGWRDRLDRIDRDSGVPHRPARSLDDELANNPDDPGTRQLWELHRARVLEQAARLKVSPPRPRVAERDPWALRFAVVLAAVAAWFVAGPQRDARLMAAFDWSGATGEAAAFRLDGWVDPPGYTQVPPTILDLRPKDGATQAAAQVRVPVGSTLVVRASSAEALAFAPEGALQPVKPEDAPAPPAGAGQPTQPAKASLQTGPASGAEGRWTVSGDGSLAVRRNGEVIGSVTIAAIPDRPPLIEILDPPEANSRGTMTLTYAMRDDYGVASAEARFATPLRNGKPIAGSRPPLVPAPTVPLSLPGGGAREGEGRTTADLSSHAWAGARVQMQLAAKDDAGQEGLSASMAVTLPQRPFTKPLAKALVEQRRDLILDPGDRARVMTALQALMIEPARFTPEPSVYLGLRTATSRLKAAKTDPELLEVADLLWEIALQIEDGNLSEAEKALRQAQERLKDAMEKGASDEEIRKLTEELRQAMDKFLREFAERMMKEQRDNPNQRQSQNDRNSRTITPKDLNSMLDRMQEMARRGDMEQAQRLLDELRNMLENLRTARPGQRDPGQQQMEQALDDLDKMTREQQELRDKTFREGQQKRQAQRGQQQGGQQGQRQRGQRGQQGQQGEQGGQGEQGQGQGDQEGQGMDGLGQNQEALRQQLEELKRKMKELGMSGEQGLDDAEQAMREAEGALGQGDDGSAVDAQGRALEGLRRGAQGMAQQMQQQGEGNEQAGEEGGPGQPGNRRAQNGQRNDDPLGRPTPSNEMGDRSKLRRAGKGGTLEQRAREVTEELRRRLGDPTRSQEELDYLQRLLRAN
jgi:uncharacterized protein (TIGR02302 family)